MISRRPPRWSGTLCRSSLRSRALGPRQTGPRPAPSVRRRSRPSPGSSSGGRFCRRRARTRRSRTRVGEEVVGVRFFLRRRRVAERGEPGDDLVVGAAVGPLVGGEVDPRACRSLEEPHVLGGSAWFAMKSSSAGATLPVPRSHSATVDAETICRPLSSSAALPPQWLFSMCCIAVPQAQAPSISPASQAAMISFGA